MTYIIPRHLEIAFSQLGIKEFENGSNPDIDKYLQVCGLSNDATPWCSAFVNWCLLEASIQPTRSAAARSFLLWGQRVIDPRPGDIVVLKRGVSKWKGHVGFFLDVNRGFIRILGGNQENRVGINSYSELRLLGYRRSLV